MAELTQETRRGHGPAVLVSSWQILQLRGCFLVWGRYPENNFPSASHCLLHKLLPAFNLHIPHEHALRMSQCESCCHSPQSVSRWSWRGRGRVSSRCHWVAHASCSRRIKGDEWEQVPRPAPACGRDRAVTSLAFTLFFWPKVSDGYPADWICWEVKISIHLLQLASSWF